MTGSSFVQTMRSLERPSHWKLGVLPGLVLLAAWLAWLLGATVDVYSSAPTARIEVMRMADRAAVRDTGRVVALHVELGAVVTQGELLAELDSSNERAQLALEQARFDSIETKSAALHRQIAAEQDLRQSRAHLDGLAKQRAVLGLEQAQTSASRDQELAEIASQLREEYVASRIDALNAEHRSRSSRIAVNDAAAEIERQSAEDTYRRKGDIARAAELDRQLAELQASAAIARAELSAAEARLEQRNVRAPAAGVLGSVASVQIGDVVKPGDLIATIVPRDEVRIVAQFPPALAVGRIVPGQSARIRLDGFSWVEFGMLEATVTQAANEPLAGGIRVEMRINADDASRIPVQHGLTGSVDVRIGQASPWTLLRRSLGDVFLTEAPPPIAEPPAPARSVGS